MAQTEVQNPPGRAIQKDSIHNVGAVFCVVRTNRSNPFIFCEAKMRAFAHRISKRIIKPWRKRRFRIPQGGPCKRQHPQRGCCFLLAEIDNLQSLILCNIPKFIYFPNTHWLYTKICFIINQRHTGYARPPKSFLPFQAEGENCDQILFISKIGHRLRPMHTMRRTQRVFRGKCRT